MGGWRKKFEFNWREYPPGVPSVSPATPVALGNDPSAHDMVPRRGADKRSLPLPTVSGSNVGLPPAAGPATADPPAADPPAPDGPETGPPVTGWGVAIKPGGAPMGADSGAPHGTSFHVVSGRVASKHPYFGVGVFVMTFRQASARRAFAVGGSKPDARAAATAGEGSAFPVVGARPDSPEQPVARAAAMKNQMVWKRSVFMSTAPRQMESQKCPVTGQRHPANSNHSLAMEQRRISPDESRCK
jgi:hypothetical protein